MARRAPRGTQDIFPEQAAAWQHLEKTAREVFELYGYGELRTPMFEKAELFIKTTGETTDIVEKEMYTFSKGRGQYALRPEATPAVVRAYLNQRLDRSAPFQKLYYIGPMFRHERPQKGRTRQFSQLGVEVLGSYSPLVDVEVISLGIHLLKAVGLEKTAVRVNTLGCAECRPGYRDALKGYFAERLEGLCDDCRRRLDRNVFRVLDCKVPTCREMLADAPRADQHQCDNCRKHFETVTATLDRLECAVEVDHSLVRGLDYYTRTVFEYVHGSLGAQDAVGGGGRYDNLIENSGGKPQGAAGFAMGMERILIASGAGEDEAALRPVACVVAVDDDCREYALATADRLRKAGISADLDFEGRSIKSQMKRANRVGAPLVVIVGPDEKDDQEATLKNMDTGEEQTLSLDKLPGAISNSPIIQTKETR